MKNFEAGVYISQGSYKSFVPNVINREWIIESMEVIDLLSKADRQLGRLDMYSEYIPNIDLPSAYKLIGELEGLGIVKEITGGKRGKQYWFHDYIDLFK